MAPLLDRLGRTWRLACGDTPEPSTVVIDSRTCPSAPSCFARGVDGGKKIRGVKVHIAVETYGIPLAIDAAPANVHDTKDIVPVLRRLAGRGFQEPAIGDLGYRGERLAKAGESLGITIQPIARGRDGMFIPSEIARVVERSFSWSSRYRRLNNHRRADERAPRRVRRNRLRLDPRTAPQEARSPGCQRVPESTHWHLPDRDRGSNAVRDAVARHPALKRAVFWQRAADIKRKEQRPASTHVNILCRGDEYWSPGLPVFCASGPIAGTRSIARNRLTGKCGPTSDCTTPPAMDRRVSRSRCWKRAGAFLIWKTPSNTSLSAGTCATTARATASCSSSGPDGGSAGSPPIRRPSTLRGWWTV
ncbi:transposase [Azospirillum halopraeferens]|uniref:transposase n=1 Tax=Azospirillum halopraeferens TaxID=34010 RepID=UPI00146FC3BA|nr:transposase [Azospirillum halopraeferens]